MTVLFASSAVARVGETLEQIDARYGKPVGPIGLRGEVAPNEDELGGEMLLYTFQGFTILVTFVDGKSEQELFKKCKEDVPCDQEWDALSADEVQAILAGYERSGVKWKPEQGQARPMWRTSADGRLKAINMMNLLMIGTVDYIDELAAKRKQIQADRLKGF